MVFVMTDEGGGLGATPFTWTASQGMSYPEFFYYYVGYMQLGAPGTFVNQTGYIIPNWVTVQNANDINLRLEYSTPQELEMYYRGLMPALAGTPWVSNYHLLDGLWVQGTSIVDPTDGNGIVFVPTDELTDDNFAEVIADALLGGIIGEDRTYTFAEWMLNEAFQLDPNWSISHPLGAFGIDLEFNANLLWIVPIVALLGVGILWLTR